ncbi:MAG: hypothetical protein V1775_13950 [Bacteroidota bacterium]
MRGKIARREAEGIGDQEEVKKNFELLISNQFLRSVASANIYATSKPGLNQGLSLNLS